MHLISRGQPVPPEIVRAEFLVPPYAGRRVLSMLPQMHALRVVQTTSAGVEWLLPHVPPGVTVCNARGARDIPVAEWVLAVILATIKDLARLRRQQDERRWGHLMLAELAGSRALIVGYGSIGEAVEARLSPFGVSIERIANSPRADVHGKDALENRLPDADIVIVIVPTTPATTDLFDEAMLGRLKPGALFVNAARGAVVDTDALVEAASEGRIRVALDVTDPEPLPPDHPLWALPNVLLSPHLAGDSDAAESRAYRFIGEQVRRYVDGEPLLNTISR